MIFYFLGGFLFVLFSVVYFFTKKPPVTKPSTILAKAK